MSIKLKDIQAKIIKVKLEKMSLAQRKEYLKAAEKVYDGLSTMAKIRHLTLS